jgi:uncharacterized protein (DUF488 family)
MEASQTSPPRPLFTVGHSNHSLERFIWLLKAHQIDVIADVRSHPYSQFTPHFNRGCLQGQLAAVGIGYVFLGVELGARRAERECYIGGNAKYDLIARLPLFQRGLDRVRRGAGSSRIALMCSEKDPIMCHRAILVGRYLRGSLLAISHVREDGALETNEHMEGRLLEATGLPSEDLYQKREDLVEQAYTLQGQTIAYVEQPGVGPGQERYEAV